MSNLGQLFDKPGEGPYTIENIKKIQNGETGILNGTNKPDPTQNTFGAFTSGEISEKKKFAGANVVNKGQAPYISYPMARGIGEKTGDTLVIKCIKFFPPGAGLGLELGVTGVFGMTNKGDIRRIENSDLEKVGADNPIFTTADAEGKSTGKRKPIKLDSNFTNANQRLLEKQEVQYYIELPAPQDIQDSNSVTWGEDTLNALELAALQVAGTAMGSNGGNDAIQAAQTAVTMLQTGVDFGGALGGDVNQAVRAAISGAAVGALGGNVSAQSIIARSTGQILNSNTELLFQGVNLRSFPFTVTFTPRNQKESEIVRVIIRSLKRSMAAKAGGDESFNGASATGIFLKSPDVFSLQYLHNGAPHPFLNSFKICALTAMSTNFTNAGTYATYSDGTPVAIRLNMTFKEISPIYFEDYGTAEAGPGVGY